MRRVLALLTVLVLLCPQAGLTEGVNAGDGWFFITAPYENVLGKPCDNGGFWYNDAFFEEPAGQVDAGLAIASAYLAAEAYQEETIRDTLTREMGFTVLDASYPTATKNYPHTIGYAIARKTIRLSGGDYNLYAVCVRGTPGSYEWVSNFGIGEFADTHAGFQTAAGVVVSAVAKNVTTDPATNILWITGHSRGAAVANLVAGSICDSDIFAAQNRVYAYTYATPNVSKNVTAYHNIVNFINPADFVTRIPLHTAWGFSRYGRDVVLPNDGETESQMKRMFTESNGRAYLGLAKWQTDAVIAQMESYAPTQHDYYHPRTDLAGYHDPRFLFDNIALCLCGHSGNAWKLLGQVTSVFGISILTTLLGLSGSSVVLSAAYLDFHPELIEFNPVKHAHSKECYIGYMRALYEDEVLARLTLPTATPAPAPTPTTGTTSAVTVTPPAQPPAAPPARVYTLPALQIEAGGPCTFYGRLEYAGDARVTRVGMLGGPSADALTEIGFDDEVPARGTLDFGYMRPVAYAPRYFQAYADVDGVRCLGEILTLNVQAAPTDTPQPPKANLAWEEMSMMGGNIAAYRRGELWGFVSRDGRVITQPVYDWLVWHPYSEELQINARRDGNLYIISPDTGEETGQTAWGMEGGSGSYWDVATNTLGYFDFNGSFKAAENEWGCVRICRCIDSRKGEACYLDGYTLVDAQSRALNGELYDTVYVSGNGFYATKAMRREAACSLGIRDGVCYLIRNDGSETPMGEDAGFFFNGIAPFCRDGLWGYLDDQGTVQAHPQYFAATSPGVYRGETYAWVKTESGWDTILLRQRRVRFPQAWEAVAIPFPNQSSLKARQPPPTVADVRPVGRHTE